jgi:hypothetical protein
MSLVADDIVIDPEEAPMVPARTPMSMSELGISVLEFRPGESSIEGTSIRTATGQRLVDRKEKPATVEMILEVAEDAEVDLPTAAYRLQQKFGSMQERETWIMRVPYVGGDFAGPILYKITGVVSLGDFAGWGRGEQPDVRVILERDPVGYSTEEIESETFSATATRQLVYTLDPSNGTAQGLRRIRVTNDGAADWRGLIWAEECRDAPDDLADPTAELAYLAKNLTPKGGASKATVSGAEVIQHTGLTAGWLTVLSSEIVGLGHMTHRGPRRMWMRIYDPGAEAGNVQLRLHWRPLGAGRWVEDNPTIPTYAVGDYTLIDLGECRPQLAVLGEERWECRLQARAVSGSGAIRIRDVYPLPTEQYVVLSEPEEPPVAEAQSTKTPGTVANNSEVGTVDWANPSNAKASDDSKATITLGSEAISHYLMATNLGFALPEGARPVSAVARIEKSSKDGPLYFTDNSVRLVVAGAVIGANKAQYPSEGWPAADTFYTYEWTAAELQALKLTRAQVNGTGFGVAIAVERAGPSEREARVDQMQITLYFTEQGQEEDKVCFATRTLELRSDGFYRQHPDDDVWGGLVPDGFNPYAPPGGLEARSSRGILIPSQGDLKTLADAGTPSKASAVVSDRSGYPFAREASAT